MNHKQSSVILIATILVLGVCLGWLAESVYNTAQLTSRTTVKEIRINSPEYKFINPLIYRDTNKENYPELRSLQASIESLIDYSVKNKKLDTVSVYFRNLNDGHWTGVNEDEKYQPASMLKVAIMIAYLKHATDEPNILLKKLYYEAADTSNQFYPPSHVLQSGYYDVQQLLEQMIVYSDNAAEKALESNDTVYIPKLYKDFQLPTIPHNEKDYVASNFMSVRSYSALFRALYNGTYLPWNLSEKALELLSLADFKEGIIAGLPKGTVVADKFGERTSQLKDGTVIGRELHNCGVVYYPGYPYLLCVMTKGQSFPDLSDTMTDISRLVYNYVVTANR